MSSTARFTAQNRRAWNEIGSLRSTIFPDAAFFAGGGSTLNERDLRAAGDVRGKQLLHLQCATGEDTLSWANHGATVTGVDISDTQIELARQKASAAKLDARFIAADIYALPSDVARGEFDIVYTGGGALCWLPDINGWAGVVCAALKRGGRLILNEEHPLAGCLHVEAGKIVVEDDYFRRANPYFSSGWRHFPGGEQAVERKADFLWPLGDIVSALLHAGLRLESLEEFPVAPAGASANRHRRRRWRCRDALCW